MVPPSLLLFAPLLAAALALQLLTDLGLGWGLEHPIPLCGAEMRSERGEGGIAASAPRRGDPRCSPGATIRGVPLRTLLGLALAALRQSPLLLVLVLVLVLLLLLLLALVLVCHNVGSHEAPGLRCQHHKIPMVGDIEVEARQPRGRARLRTLRRGKGEGGGA